MGKKEPKLAFPIEAMTQNFLFTDTQDVWVGYKLDRKELPLNKVDFFREYIEEGEGLFEHDSYDYHFVNVPEYFDLDQHIEDTIDTIVKGSFADLGEFYFRQAGEILKEEIQVNQYITYLFVKLSTPIQVADPLEYVELIKDFGTRQIFRMTGQRIPRSTLLSSYRRAEQQLYQDLANNKLISRLETRQMARIYYYFFHRASTRLPQRELLAEEINEGIIENHKGYVTIEQADKTHYVAFLSVVDLPTSSFGSAFIQRAQEMIRFSFETHVQVRFEHEKKDQKHVYKMRKRIYEQDKEQQTVDAVLNEDEVILFGEERLNELNERLKRKDRRLCRTTVTFCIAAADLATLEERIKDFYFHFEVTDWKIYRPLVDQLTLFDQCLIGTKRSFRSYEQVLTTGFIADFGLDLVRQVGNNMGFPLGRIITIRNIKDRDQALNLSNKIVWFYPNLTKRAIAGALHTNGNTLITGPPGQGKSVLVKYIFLWLTFLGQKILYVDPKNETEKFFKRALEKYSHEPKFVDLYHRINFISLSSNERYRGMLDPLMFLPREEAIQTARTVLENFGEVNTDPATANHKKALILSAVEKVINGRGKKHLTKVIEEIRLKDEELAKLISGYNTGLGKILLGNDQSEPLRFENQINVLGTQGLQIPTQEEITAHRLNNEQIAGMSIMEVIMKMTYIFSTNKDEDAAIIFDEAKGFEDTSQGRYLIEDSLRKGRANATDIYLVTQAFMDYDREDKKELLSYKFAFRPNQEEAQGKILRFFGMEQNRANMELINKLKPGTCLFQDHLGRNQAIAIDVLFDSWMLAISSTDQKDEATQAALAIEGKN